MRLDPIVAPLWSAAFGRYVVWLIQGAGFATGWMLAHAAWAWIAVHP